MTWFASASPKERYHAFRGVLAIVIAVIAEVFLLGVNKDLPWFAHLIVLFLVISAGMQFYLSYAVRQNRLAAAPDHLKEDRP